MSQSNYEIRDFKPGDYEQMLAMWELTGLGNAARGDDLEIIEQTIKIGGKLLIMIQKESSKLVGSSWMTSDGRRLYIHHFGIHPDFQGRGLSHQLMEASMKFAKELGQQVKLEVHTTNTRAINLYKKYGFKYLGDYHVYIIREIQKSEKH